MSIDDRQRWERRHQSPSDLTQRDAVLALEPAAQAGALALDLACGQGRHSVALANRGYLVVAMDVSPSALAHARRRMRTIAGDNPTGGLAPVCADADHWPFAKDSFALIVQVDFLDRALFPAIGASLQPGGLLLIDTFLDQGSPNAQGPSRRDFLLRPNELLTAFPALHTLRYEETRGQTGRALYLGRRV